MMTQDLRTMFIKDVESLSTRTKNCLISAGIITVQDLLDFWKTIGTRESRSMELQEAGEVTFREIRDFMTYIELKTGVSVSATNTIYDVPTFSTRTLNILRCLEIYTIQELFDYNIKYGINKFRQARNAGDKTIKEISDFLSSFGAPVDTKAKQIQDLKSKISEYEHAVARMKAELAKLETKRKTTNNKQKEH